MVFNQTYSRSFYFHVLLQSTLVKCTAFYYHDSNLPFSLFKLLILIFMKVIMKKSFTILNTGYCKRKIDYWGRAFIFNCIHEQLIFLLVTIQSGDRWPDTESRIFIWGFFMQNTNTVVFETVLRYILSICFASQASSQITCEIQFLFSFFLCVLPEIGDNF